MSWGRVLNIYNKGMRDCSILCSKERNNANSEIPEDLDEFEHQDIGQQIFYNVCRWPEVGHMSKIYKGAMTEVLILQHSCRKGSQGAARGRRTGSPSSGSALCAAAPLQGNRRARRHPNLCVLSLRKHNCQEGLSCWSVSKEDSLEVTNQSL